jgi:hypothetical protein
MGQRIPPPPPPKMTPGEPFGGFNPWWAPIVVYAVLTALLIWMAAR